jgi:TetR/AcrR family transcriptional regulator of autoinduction and epiphytic fitness
MPRTYNAPQRAAAAGRTREAILTSAKHTFESRDWAGATLRSIAERAEVSPKTVVAIYGTKANLLRQVVDFAIRGDTRPVTMPRREAILAIEAAETATEMLDLHTIHLRTVLQRSAQIARVVEHGARSDPDLAVLWRRMTANRRTGTTWATETLLKKHDAPQHLDHDHVLNTFWLALDWGTYRTLTEHQRLTPDTYQTWLRNYYRNMLKR